jgi:hypothetical protein
MNKITGRNKSSAKFPLPGVDAFNCGEAERGSSVRARLGGGIEQFRFLAVNECAARCVKSAD